MSLRSVLKSATPTIVHEIVKAQRELAVISGSTPIRSWSAACSPGVRAAIERSRFALLPHWLRRPLSFVVDVGANEGQWVASLLGLLNIQEVWVFEPNPEAMRECRRLVGHHGGITFKEMALGSKADSAVLHITKSSDFSSLLRPNTALIQANYKNDPTEIVAERTVEVAALDDLVPASKQVDLLKIDVQGVERDVLTGAKKTLQRTTAVLLEVNFRSHYEGDETFGSLHSLMTRDLGLQLWGISPPYRGTSGEALWADALFVNPDRVQAAEAPGLLSREASRV